MLVVATACVGEGGEKWGGGFGHHDLSHKEKEQKSGQIPPCPPPRQTRGKKKKERGQEHFS